jgi:hypothetical protein
MRVMTSAIVLQCIDAVLAQRDEQVRLEFSVAIGVLRTWMGERPSLRPARMTYLGSRMCIAAEVCHHGAEAIACPYFYRCMSLPMAVDAVGLGVAGVPSSNPVVGPVGKRRESHMTDNNTANTANVQIDEDFLSYTVSDEALEAAVYCGVWPWPAGPVIPTYEVASCGSTLHVSCLVM